LLRVFQRKRYLPEQLRDLLVNIVALKDESSIADGSHWALHIRKRIEQWSKRL